MPREIVESSTRACHITPPEDRKEGGSRRFSEPNQCPKRRLANKRVGPGGGRENQSLNRGETSNADGA